MARKPFQAREGVLELEPEDDRLRIFISYPTSDGLDIAREARHIFDGVGHKPWMWEHNRTLGALTWKEISNRIVSDTDLVFFICTASTTTSYGQALETSYALNHRVKVLAICLGSDPVPTELTAFNYGTWERSQFAQECRRLANDLPEIVERVQRLGRDINARQEPSRIAERLKQIQELNARTAQLDSKRVLECKEAVWRSYKTETLPRQVASLSQEFDPQAPGFQRIELWARIKLKDFNDPTFQWIPYFSDVGRAMVTGERNYLQETIRKQVSADALTISRSNPDFRVLTDRIQVLAQGNLVPDTILAPVELTIPFIKFYGAQIDWSANRERLTIGGAQLRIFWSHRYAPLDRFIIFSSKAGTWHVIPDQETGQALTIARGQFKFYPDEVAYGVETTVRYEVTHPDDFCVIALSA